MNAVKVNPLSKAFTNNIKEGYEQGYTVVCAQRPINGVVAWQQEQTLGNGIYFAYGSLEQYKDHWTFLDASPVIVQTNNDVMELIKQECINEGVSLDEVLECSSIEELANDLGLVYIQAEEDTISDFWKATSETKKYVKKEAGLKEDTKTTYNEDIVYYFYKNTFKTYLEAVTYATKNRTSITMILPSNHPTMTNERLQYLEYEYTFSKHTMDYEEMKEYRNYIESLSTSKDQQERLYNIQSYIQRHEWKVQQKVEEAQRIKDAMNETGKLLNVMKEKGMTRKSIGDSEGFYYKGELIYFWSGGMSVIEFNKKIKEVYGKYFSVQDAS